MVGLVIVDGTRLYATYGLEELHSFAFQIELRRTWFRPHETLPFYQIPSTKMLLLALKEGATLVSLPTTVAETQRRHLLEGGTAIAD